MLARRLFPLVLWWPLVALQSNWTAILTLDDHHVFSSEFPRDAVLALRDLICCIETHAIHVYFDELRTSDTTNNILRHVNSCRSASVVVKTYAIESHSGRNQLRKYTSLHVFIFRDPDLQRIKNYLSVFHRKTEGKQHLKFFVVIESVHVSDFRFDWLSQMFQLFWRKHVLNVVVVLFRGYLRVFTFHPFLELPTSGRTFEPIQLRVDNCSDLFFDKLTNLGGKVLTASMFGDEIRAIHDPESRSYSGIDGNMLALIGERLNARINFLTPMDRTTYGVPLPNGTITGGLGDVTDERAHFSFNSRFMNPDFQENNVETTNSYERDDLCVIVPKAQPTPLFHNLFRTLDPATWCAFIGVLIGITAIILLVQFLQRKLLRHDADMEVYSTADVVSLVLQSLFGDSIKYVPNSKQFRLVLGGWILYSFLICSAFNGTLVSKLVVPVYESEINSIAQLNASGLPIAVPMPMVAVLEDNLEPELWQNFRLRILSLSDVDFQAHLNLNKTDVAFVMKSHRADYVSYKNYQRDTGRPVYHKMKSCLVYFPMTYIVAQGSPYLGRINELLSRIREAGIATHWEILFEFQATIQGKLIDEEEQEERDENPETKVVLSIGHLQSAFYMLAIGLSLSMVIFVAELLFAYYIEYVGLQVIVLNVPSNWRQRLHARIFRN